MSYAMIMVAAVVLALPRSGYTVTSLAAQEAADTADVAQRFQAAVDSIHTLDAALAAMDRWRVGAAGDDGRLLRERRQVRAQTRRNLIKELAGLVPSLPEGAELSAQRGLVDSLLAVEATALRGEILALVEEVSSMRVGMDDLEGTERAAFEQRTARIDRTIDEKLAEYHEALADRAELGADVSASLAELDALLTMRAEVLAGRMERAEQDIAAMHQRFDKGESGLDAAVAALDFRVSETASSLGRVLDLMEARDLQTAEFRRYLLVTTGDLTTENLSLGVVQGLLGEWSMRAKEWVAANGVNVVFKALIFLAILAVFWIGASVLKRVMARTLEASRFQMSSLLRETLVRWTARGVIVVGIFIALSQMGVQLGPVLAGLGVAGFIVGFALQDSLSNFAAGVMILLYRPFDVGDVVEVGGVLGKIADMSLVSTTILSFDNQRYVVPNNKIWGGIIRNVTAMDTRRVDLAFGIGYQDDIPKAEKVLQDIVTQHELVLDDPAPVIKLQELGDSSVNFIVRPWCKTSDYWDVYFDITRAVKMRFDEEGISIPFPQRDVHVYHEGNGQAETGASAAGAGSFLGKGGAGSRSQ